MHYEARPTWASDDVLAEYLDEARSIFDAVDPADAPEQPPLNATASFEDLRWFLLPDEVRTHE